MIRGARALLVASLLSLPCPASKPRCRLDRYVAEPDGRPRLYLSVVELEGQLVDGLGPERFRLRADGHDGGPSVRVQRFSALREPMELALLVEASTAYRPALTALRAALASFLNDEPPWLRASLILYGADLEERVPMAPATALAPEIEALEVDGEVGAPRLADGLHLALTSLQRRPAPMRRAIVVISDGIDARMDRQTFRSQGDAARAAGIPIHSIAFSPRDERGPLLNLGELSKRSNGTFRWARRAADLATELGQLGEELREQYVVMFASPLPPSTRTLAANCGDLTSNVLVLREAERRAARWPWAILAGLVAVATTTILRRRRRRR